MSYLIPPLGGGIMISMGPLNERLEMLARRSRKEMGGDFF
jgi:hypothetical protein